MKITKKNYVYIFKSLCKHFGIKGFCIKINNYNFINALVGVIGKNNGKLFINYDHYGDIITSKYLDDLLEKCPIMFKDQAILSFKDIAYWCHIEDINKIVFNFTKEIADKLCRNNIVFNSKKYKKISIEELLVEADLN